MCIRDSSLCVFFSAFHINNLLVVIAGMSLPRLLIVYSSTLIPILLAVPAIMLIAASKDAAFKSGIFISAISWILALEIVATFVLFGTPEPDLMLQAFFNKTAAGGVFVMKLKLLSAYTVITTGMIKSPSVSYTHLHRFPF